MSISDRLSEVRARIVRAREGRQTDRYMVLDVDAPALVGAIRAVLDLHEGAPNSVSAMYPNPACNECGQTMPCPTVRAIATALGEA